MLEDAELKEELRQEMLQEAHEEEIHERKMYTDWDYAVDHMDFNSEMTIGEFASAINTLKDSYDWHVENRDVLELLELATNS